MDDKQMMSNILTSAKSLCGLMMHGTIESSTCNVHQTFHNNLDQSLKMQDDIYKQMSQKGWYPTQQVEQQKISDVKQKFAGQQTNSHNCNCHH